jgi:hypothetical protein
MAQGSSPTSLFREEMGHLVCFSVWEFDLFSMSFGGYVMDWARGKHQAVQRYCKPFWVYVRTHVLGGICFLFGKIEEFFLDL